jgi:hypothetical protein
MELPTLWLVSCVSMKRGHACRARDLYVSPWFLKARRHVEESGMPWLILSAEYGLLDPDAVVAPYERTLNEMGVAERRAWARGVLDALGPRLQGVGRVVVLAGERYREFLMPALRAACPDVQVPLEGLGIGKQLRWFDQRRSAA